MPVYVRREYKNFNVNIWQLKKWLNKILKDLNCEDMELSILLVNDEKIRKLNAKYRKINKSTDVLSFPQINEGNPQQFLLGDVVVSTDTAWRQAHNHGLAFEEELLLLLIHGTLHLLGYDHERSSQEAQKMKRKTRSLFNIFFPETELGDSVQF